MKKLILFALLLIALKASSQQNYFNFSPPGSTSFTPTFRFTGLATDSLGMKVYLSNGGKFWQIPTFVQANSIFATLFSPKFGGIPTSPTPLTSDSSNRIETTAGMLQYAALHAKYLDTEYFKNPGSFSLPIALRSLLVLDTVRTTVTPSNIYDVVTLGYANSHYTGGGGGTTTNPLSLTYGFTGQPLSFNGSAAITGQIDSTKLQTVLNFFPKGDTRYQKILISGTNIKTINSTSLLGSGNILTPNIYNSDGTLTGTRTLSIGTGNNLAIQGTQSYIGEDNLQNNIQSVSNDGLHHSQLHQINANIDLSINDNSGNNAGLQFSTGGLFVVDLLNFKGLQEMSDYSGNYTARNYITKGYADATYTTGSSGSFIKNQTSQQASSNFNISGIGVAGSNFTVQKTAANSPSFLINDGSGLELVRIASDNNTNFYAGYKAGFSNTTGTNNTYEGSQAGYSNSTGTNNTAFGTQALYTNTGIYNTAVGYQALYSNTTGQTSTAFGVFALMSNTTGSYNNAIGFRALQSNTTGNYNNAIGYNTLFANTTGYSNVAIGSFSTLSANTTGFYNIALGDGALAANIGGSSNQAIGINSLAANTSGINNNAFGNAALQSNTTGNYNIGNGYEAGGNITTGSYNIVLGAWVNAPSATANAQLNIGNVLYGTGLFQGTIANSSTPTTTGSIGIGLTTPTARLHLAAGTTTANTAPLKFTSGILTTTPEDGAVEYDGTHFYGTVGSTRYQLDQQSGGGGGTVNTIGVTTANGISGTSSGGANPSLTIALGAITPTSTNGVSAATMAFNDATSSIQTQLNGKQASGSYLITTNNLSDLSNIATARVNIGQDKKTAVADANYTILATDKAVQMTSITAARTLTLPAASAVNAGYELIIGDISGSVSATNTITITRAGSDLINGATTEVIPSAYGQRVLFSDGVSKWSFDAGIVRLAVSQALINKDLTGAGNTFPTFNQNTTGNAATVTTNANLTGPVTSVGNATTITAASVTNAMLANSTISGISLGGTLGALTATDATLTFSGSYTGAAARTIGLNLGNANTWTGIQTFTTPVLGAATAISINGNIFTTGTYTLTGAAAKTLTFNNSLILAGTDATTMTFPTTSATIARTDVAQTFTGHNTFEGVTPTGATGTGNMVFSLSPTFTGTITAGTISATSTVSTGNSFMNSKSSIATSPADGLALTNTTAATSGVPNQWSTRIRFANRVWNTTSAANNEGDFINEARTTSGAVPITKLFWAGGISTTIGTPNLVDLMSLDNSGLLSVTHLSSITAAPTIAAGTGAGTSPTVTVTGNDVAEKVSVTTGTSPTVSATVATITFNVAYGVAPKVILTPANAATAALNGTAAVYIDDSTIGTTTYAIKVGSGGLAASTAYIWYAQVIQ